MYPQLDASLCQLVIIIIISKVLLLSANLHELTFLWNLTPSLGKFKWKLDLIKAVPISLLDGWGLQRRRQRKKIVMGFEFIIPIIIPSERGDLKRDFRQRQWRLNGIREKEIRQTWLISWWFRRSLRARIFHDTGLSVTMVIKQSFDGSSRRCGWEICAGIESSDEGRTVLMLCAKLYCHWNWLKSFFGDLQ